MSLSMGMSADYKIAIEHGSTMVRVGQYGVLGKGLSNTGRITDD